MSRTEPKLPRGIDRRVNGMFRARVVYDGIQYSLGSFYTVGDAKAALAIARSEMARRTFRPPAERRKEARQLREAEKKNTVTVRQWATAWLQQLEDQGKSPGTTKSYASTLRVHVLDRIGDARLVDVTSEAINELVADAKRRGAPVTNIARTLRALFNGAVEDPTTGLLESPVRLTIKKPVPHELEDSTIATPEQVRALTAAMPAELQIAVPIAAWCCLRLGEVLGLQRRDFTSLDDPQNARLHVRRQWNSKASPPAYTQPKAGSTRVVAIPAALVPGIAAHLDSYTGREPEAPLMPSPRMPSTPVSQTAFDRTWRKTREAVLPGFVFHALRHTGLTRYAQQGATAKELMARGGHRSAEVSQRYQHAEAARDRALTDRLNAVIGGEDE